MTDYPEHDASYEEARKTGYLIAFLFRPTTFSEAQDLYDRTLQRAKAYVSSRHRLTTQDERASRQDAAIAEGFRAGFERGMDASAAGADLEAHSAVEGNAEN